MVSVAALPGAATIVPLSIAGLLLIGALVLVMRARDDAFPLLAVLALPFRVPVSADGRTVNLLIPLYLVVAAGTIAHLLPRLIAVIAGARAGDGARGARAPAEGPRMPDMPGKPDTLVEPGAPGMPGRLSFWSSPRGLQLLLLAAVGLYALQVSYSADQVKGAENLAFFYVPFGLMFAILRDVDWTRDLLLRCLAVLVALAVLFAGVGFVEYSRKSLFLNPKIVAANQYDNYFRVNSLFFDPSIYGRFLALIMLALSTVVLWSTRRRDILLGGALLAWLLGGLITSFSQSSIAALLLGLIVLAAWRWSVRVTLGISGALLALALAVVLLAPSSWHFGLKGSSGSTSNASNGRTKLISGGLELFAKRPLEGYGSGAFETAYKRHRDTTAENATSASHTIPVTVAAEQGILGLALYFALICSALLVLFRGAGRSPPRIAVAACFAALVLHTWTYADFLEDPSTWLLLAIGLALARQGARIGSEPCSAT